MLGVDEENCTERELNQFSFISHNGVLYLVGSMSIVLCLAKASYSADHYNILIKKSINPNVSYAHLYQWHFLHSKNRSHAKFQILRRAAEIQILIPIYVAEQTNKFLLRNWCKIIYGAVPKWRHIFSVLPPQECILFETWRNLGTALRKSDRSYLLICFNCYI